METAARPSLHRPVLFIAVLASFLTPFMGSSVNIALPAVGRTFGLSAVQLSWVAMSYLVAAGAFLIPFGRLADIFGRKKMFSLGMSVYIISSLLSAFSRGFGLLLFSRFLQGIGASMIFSTSLAMVTSVFEPGRRGHAIGITTGVTYIGLSAGPVLGGWLTHLFGWRSLFWFPVFLGLPVLVLLARRLRGVEWSEARGEPFDWTGSMLCITALSLVAVGLSALTRGLGIAALLLGLAALGRFILHERRSANPILAPAVFRNNPVFIFSNAAALINYSATFAAGFLLSLYLQTARSLTPQNAGLILMAQPVAMALLSPFAGRLSDRIEPRIVASIGMALTTLSLVLFATLSAGTPIVRILEGLVVLGAGLALFSSPNTNAIITSVEKKHFGVASATAGTMRLTGQMFSMGIATLVFSLTIGTQRITADLVPGFVKSLRLSFWIFAALAIPGTWASLVRGNVHGGSAGTGRKITGLRFSARNRRPSKTSGTVKIRRPAKTSRTTRDGFHEGRSLSPEDRP